MRLFEGTFLLDLAQFFLSLFYDQHMANQQTIIENIVGYPPGPSFSKLNEVVSYHDVKISILKYGKCFDIFAEKNVSSFCIAKATHIFAAKISMYLKIP